MLGLGSLFSNITHGAGGEDPGSDSSSLGDLEEVEMWECPKCLRMHPYTTEACDSCNLPHGPEHWGTRAIYGEKDMEKQLRFPKTKKEVNKALEKLLGKQRAFIFDTSKHGTNAFNSRKLKKIERKLVELMSLYNQMPVDPAQVHPARRLRQEARNERFAQLQPEDIKEQEDSDLSGVSESDDNDITKAKRYLRRKDKKRRHWSTN